MPTEDHTVQGNIPIDGVHWVDMFVREMMSATSIDDARARASRLLVALEKTICVQAGAEAAQNIQKVSIYKYSSLVSYDLISLSQSMSKTIFIIRS